MTNIRRYTTTGRPVFITAVTYRRIPYLNTDSHKKLLISVMRELKTSTNFKMHAYVILDDHFHWIITPAGKPFPKVMQSLKLRFVHQFKKTNKCQSSLKLWQQRYWDHVIRNTEDMNQHMDYIHYNPIKHGYTTRPMDYPWSSFVTHVQLGHYDANWGEKPVSENVLSMDLE
jgi:putative transposase